MSSPAVNSSVDAPACEACRTGTRRAESLERELGKPAEQKLWRCPACAHVQVSPMPPAERIASYYAYDAETMERHGLKLKWNAGNRTISPTYRRRLEFAARSLPKGARLLDVGYGNGMFLRAACEFGFRVTGVDPDDRHFQPDFPCELKQAVLGPGTFPPGSFDVIAAHHVLEHVADLAEMLGVLHELLTPGGLLLIELPHEVKSLVKRLRRRFAGEKYSYISSHQHLRFFTTLSLRAVLARSGFVVEKCRSVPAWEFLEFPRSLALLPASPFEIIFDAGFLLEAVGERGMHCA